MNLIDGLLGQPVAWLGIEEPQKKTKLSEIQSRMDNISHSLVRYSDSGEHEYNSNSEREFNGAAADLEAWRSGRNLGGKFKIVCYPLHHESAWLLLSFCPFPVRHPV